MLSVAEATEVRPVPPSILIVSPWLMPCVGPESPAIDKSVPDVIWEASIAIGVVLAALSRPFASTVKTATELADP